VTNFDFIKEQKGASAIEFAIVLPLFLVLVFGIIEFGVIMYDKAVITNASREGARFGILFDEPVNSDAEILSKVNTHLNNGGLLITLGGTANTPSVTVDRTALPLLSVSVAYNYDFLIVPNFVPGIPQTLSLSATTTMRME
jgi:Flp pilus assembly protein TadG